MGGKTESTWPIFKTQTLVRNEKKTELGEPQLPCLNEKMHNREWSSRTRLICKEGLRADPSLSLMVGVQGLGYPNIIERQESCG